VLNQLLLPLGVNSEPGTLFSDDETEVVSPRIIEGLMATESPAQRGAASMAPVRHLSQAHPFGLRLGRAENPERFHCPFCPQIAHIEGESTTSASGGLSKCSPLGRDVLCFCSSNDNDLGSFNGRSAGRETD
jgi:hypothetical protein